MNQTTPAGPAVATTGHNNPPPEAQAVADRMALDYAKLAEDTTLALGTARDLPETVEDDKTLGAYTGVIVRLKALAKDADAYRVREKGPYLAAERAVDAHFKGITDRLDKAVKALHARAHAFNLRKEAEERARRQREAEETARVQREAEAKRIEAERIAQEAREAAERARKPEIVEQKHEIASEKADEAAVARVDHLMTSDAADAARIASLQKPADLVRQRHDEGTMTTMKTVGYVEVVDRDLLDMSKLRPFFTDAELLKALRAYAKTGSFKNSMPGAIIDMRPDTVIR